jgi:hypothetical protein
MDQSPKALAVRHAILRYFEVIKGETEFLRHKVLSDSPAESSTGKIKSPMEE